MSLHRRKEHPDYIEGCFGCKISTLSVASGDANSKMLMSNKKWDNELSAYKEARKEGIQPAGTSMKAIEESYRASDVLGKAYNAETMPKATDIDKSTAQVMREVGI